MPGWAFVVLGVLIAGTVRASNIAGMAARDRLLNEIMPPDVAAEVRARMKPPGLTSAAFLEKTPLLTRRDGVAPSLQLWCLGEHGFSRDRRLR